MALMAGAMFTACGGDDDDNGGGNGGGGNEGPGTIPGVTVDNMLSGSVKAGFAGAIEILGSGFDPDQDWVYIGYNEGGEIKYERITTDLLTIRSSRISFGVPITAGYLDKTFKVYLDREATKMELTKDLTFTMPTIAEGYIPDPYFRATLMSTHPQQGNPEIAPLFNSYGLIDVAGAAAVETINLYASGVTSLEGIELFTHCGRIIAHETSSLVKADFSKLKTDQYLFVTMERSGAMEEVIAGPTISRLDIYDCSKLKTVDLHLNKWMHNLQCYGDPAIETFAANIPGRSRTRKKNLMSIVTAITSIRFSSRAPSCSFRTMFTFWSITHLSRRNARLAIMAALRVSTTPGRAVRRSTFIRRRTSARSWVPFRCTRTTVAR